MSHIDKISKSIRRRILLFIAIMVSGLFSACGFVGPGTSAVKVADTFYDSQQAVLDTEPSAVFVSLFIDARDAADAQKIINLRVEKYGRYESHRRIGSNRHVQLTGAGRRESAVFIFEVSSQQGLTRETLTISRSSATEPFHITEYIVEDAGQRADPSPPGTSST